MGDLSSTKEKVASNLVWRLLERFGAQFVTLIVSIVLARILDPTAYGTIALVMVFVAILQVFVESGLATALIQKKEADDLDFSTVFHFNIVASLLLYFLLFFLSPLVAEFFNKDELTIILRILGLSVIISGIKSVQQSFIAREMKFRLFFFATLGGTIGAAIIGIWFALLGFGVWALVAQYLFNLTVDTIILSLLIKWHPKMIFSFERLKSLFSYGWKLLISALIATTYNELQSLVIGKRYSSDSLAFFDRGRQFPNLIVTNINSSIDSVLLPTMSKEQDNKERVKLMTRRSIKISTYIMMPMMVGLAVCAEPIVLLLLTEKWLPAVPFLRIFCIIYAFYPIHTANLNAIKAVGRSDYFLIIEIIKKLVGLTIIFITMFISVEAIAYGMIITTILSQIINSWPNKKLLNYSYFDQIKDMAPQLLLSLLMGVFVFLIGIIPFPAWAILIIQVSSGVVIYIVLSRLFRIDSYYYVVDLCKKMLVPKINRITKRG